MFQSTHPRGVRPARSRRRHCWRYRFNPRTRVGCDAGLYGLSTIRSPGFNPRTRVGCDHPHSAHTSARCGFNPRTRVGCDGIFAGFFNWLREFQSTHPRGVRLSARLILPCVSWVSIHAPAWGATGQHLHGAGFGQLRDVSIHAPAWGATLKPCPACGSSAVSIHAPAWGATHGRHCHSDRQRCFNPRTRVGCDSAR